MNQQSILCPACKKPFEPNTASPDMPFCSSRCKMADLNRWLSEDISLPSGSSEPEDEGEEPETPIAPREWKF